MIAILDPGTPKWLIDRLRTAVPELFADYVKLTGATLDRKPALFLSFQPAADPNSTTWKGGTLTGVIQMHIEAVKDAPENPDLLERFFKFLAHEAAHLWNGQMFQNNERNQSWLHEGGADAFAWRALHRAGILDDRALTQKQVLDLNTCLALLGNESLHAAETGGNFRPVYHCGSALAWLTEAALRMRDPGADLHTIWRDLFQEAAKRSGKYDEALFLSILEDRTRDEELLRYFDDFLHGTMTNRVERTIAAFNAQGVKLAAAPELMPAGERRQWSMNLLGELMRQDCAGSFSYTRRGSGWVLHGSPGCATLKTDVVVETAEGHSLLREGAAAYDAATGRCQAGETVRLAGPAGEIAIPCRPLPARPPWLTVP
jgi:hypothetical protein